jgi:hypothetical protein
VLFSLVLFVTYYAVSLLHFKFQMLLENSYKVYPLILISSIFYIPVGIILGLFHLFEQQKQEGKWKINIIKILIFGIPSLYFMYYDFIYIFFFPNVNPFLFGKINAFIPSVIFGYFITTSFYKVKINP